MKFHEKLMKSHTILVQAEYDTDARMVGRRLEAALCMTMSTEYGYICTYQPCED